MRVIQRKIEEHLGEALIKSFEKRAMIKSKLLRKSVFLPKANSTINYLERESTGKKTLLFCHGITDQAKNLCTFITSLNIPDDVRILVPDALGHGKNLECSPPEKSYTSSDILNATIEFLEVLVNNSNSNSCCNVFGISMGGALAYFLRYKRPDLVQKLVLISPALEHCLNEEFIEDFQSGRKNHFCFESRKDVKIFFRDVSTPHRRKKNPVPKFVLETIFRSQQKTAPKGHFRKMFSSFLEQIGKSFMSVDKDIDEHSPRVVIWPENDFICNHEKGRKFFCNSKMTTFETIQNCGHVFHSDGSLVYDSVRVLVSKHLCDFSCDITK